MLSLNLTSAEYFMNDNLRMTVIERLNDICNQLNAQILEIQVVAADLRMSPMETTSESEPAAQAEQQDSQDYAKMQETIARLEKLVLNMQSAPAQAPEKPTPDEPRSKAEDDKKQDKKGEVAPNSVDEKKDAPLVLDENLLVKAEAPKRARKKAKPVEAVKAPVKETKTADPLLLTDPIKT